MAEPLRRALSRLRGHLLDENTLSRAAASGRRRGLDAPPWRRVELRYVDLKTGRHLQVTRYDETQAHTANHAVGEAAASVVDQLLDLPFGNWHLDTTTESLQVRVTKKGEALAHRRPRAEEAAPARDHDRAKSRVMPEHDPVLRAVGIADDRGRVKPSRQAKYRQVEEFLRDLGPVLDDALSSGQLRTPTPDRPLRVVDLGCGNAYLTFAAHRYLTAIRGLPVHLVGVDVKEQSRRHNSAVAAELGVAESLTFVRGDIGSVALDELPDVVLALHACDTATDDALARAVEWNAALVLAAPCCHHDLAVQLRQTEVPAPYAMLTRHGILRERFADTLTDAVRATLLRRVGYRVDVIEFVDSAHTPRNTLLRAVRTGADAGPAREEYDGLIRAWHVRPRLAELLGERLH